MFFNSGSLESSCKKLLVGCFQLARLVSQYWASLWDLLFWQLRFVVRQIRFEVTGLFACVPIMVSFVRVFEREIVGWLVSVGQVRLEIVSFALTCAQLKTVMNCEANWFWINWLLRMFFNSGSLESSCKKLLVGCFLLAGLVLKYWASLWDLLFWQLRSVVRQIRFEVTGFFACVPIMVSFVRVFEREIVGWLVSVGQVRLAIVSFALTRAQLKTVMNCGANWFWINWLLRMFFNNGSLESSSKKLLVGCFLLAGLVLKYWASPVYMLYWQLISVLRQTRFEVTGLCALFPIMVSFVRVFEREIVGWLVSVGQVTLAIVNFV